MDDSKLKSKKLFEIANRLAHSTPGFNKRLGPGAKGGNGATNIFVAELRRRAQTEFGFDYSEVSYGDHSSKFDYFFPDEGTVVEVAFGLRNPNCEFEKDIFKCAMAKNHGDINIKKLLFLAKPGGKEKCEQPFRSAVVKFSESAFGFEISVKDLLQ